MISFPPCKINIGLNIVRKRTDGYHDIETCFMPVAWCDVLEIIPASETTIYQTGIPILGEPTANIVFKAYDVLSKDYTLPPVEIHLHKVIPHGAGLGGGSSDGAFALNMLNAYFDLGVPEHRIHQYALQLGSDCPYFLNPRPMLGFGRGELLQPVVLPIEGKFITLINPRVHVSTVQAYQGVVPRQPQISIQDALALPIETWQNNIKNDFEDSVFKSHPLIEKVKIALYHAGAFYASMSGSGSTVYGIFDAPFDGSVLFPDFSCWSGQIRFDKLSF